MLSRFKYSVIVLFFLCSCRKESIELISVEGSDTLLIKKSVPCESFYRAGEIGKIHVVLDSVLIVPPGTSKQLTISNHKIIFSNYSYGDSSTITQSSRQTISYVGRDFEIMNFDTLSSSDKSVFATPKKHNSQSLICIDVVWGDPSPYSWNTDYYLGEYRRSHSTVQVNKTYWYGDTSYIAFRFKVNDDYAYGWIRMSAELGGDLQVFEYAYQ